MLGTEAGSKDRLEGILLESDIPRHYPNVL